MTHTIGFVGLGRMGQPMARRLLGAGHSLVVCDLDTERVDRFCADGALAEPDPAAVADAADIVMICMLTPAIVREVTVGKRGIINGKRAKYVVDLSTTGPRVSRELYDRLALDDKTLVDCPVTGGIARAIDGTLTLMLGADCQSIDVLRPYLECIGRKLVVAGARAGDGQMLKILNNMLSFVALESTAEVMVLGVKAGLDPRTMLETFNAGTGRNSATEEKFAHSVLTRNFNFGFELKNLMKDIGLCLAEAEQLGVAMPVGNTVRQMFQMAAGERPNEDMTSIVKLFERSAGVEVRNPD